MYIIVAHDPTHRLTKKKTSHMRLGASKHISGEDEHWLGLDEKFAVASMSSRTSSAAEKRKTFAVLTVGVEHL